MEFQASFPVEATGMRLDGSEGGAQTQGQHHDLTAGSPPDMSPKLKH
jgi:hypothetical protein